MFISSVLSCAMCIKNLALSLLLLFIKNILGVLIGQELKGKSSHPLGSCSNLGLKINVRHYDSFGRTLETNIRHYDSFRRILTDLVI